MSSALSYEQARRLLQVERDARLDELSETYNPRLRALHEELAQRRDEVWMDYQARLARLDRTYTPG